MTAGAKFEYSCVPHFSIFVQKSSRYSDLHPKVLQSSRICNFNQYYCHTDTRVKFATLIPDCHIATNERNSLSIVYT